MKAFKLTILFFAYILIGHAQNLVPNSSFENTLFCPTGPGQINSLVNWFAAARTPDNFNSCNTNPFYVSVPQNGQGYQMPATGNGYAGLFSYSNQTSNSREIIGVQLTSPLIISLTYFVSFKAVSAKVNCTSNNLGVYFSNVYYDGINDTLKVNNSSQVYSSQVLVDTLNWTSLNFAFVPDSNYSYMYIGNFFSDSLTTYQYTGAGCSPYYYIDDLYVSLDSLTSNNTLNDQLEFSIFPNPTQDIITVQNLRHHSVQIEIYNYLGALLKKIEATNDKEIILDISELSQGLYFINLQSDNNVKIARKITKL